MSNIAKALIVEAVIFAFLIVLFMFISRDNNIREVCFQDKCFSVELAKTQEEQIRGLMYRNNLDSSHGMLFVFNNEGNYGIWMKNTLIPLDIIWMDQSGKVVFVKQNAQPCDETCPSMYPTENAKYILEINGGESQDAGIKVGDNAQFKQS